MELEFKRDFETAADQWDKFWKGRNTRPMVSAIIPKPGVTPVPKPPYACGATGDFEGVIDQLLGWAGTHDFLAEAIPFFYLEFGADHFAALLGADLKFDNSDPGGWAVPFVEDLATVDIRFDPKRKWWKRTEAFARALRARCDGKLLIASNTLVSNLDALSAIRGPQNLLMDLLDNPDAIHRALAQIDQAHADILEALAGLLDYPRFGSINRHGMYCRGRINVPQCDFSCMISPDQFREFALPYLRKEMGRLDAVEYHLDGPDAIRHLDALCEIDDLDVIQWVPGSGENERKDWTPLLDRIDALNKGQIRGGSPAKASQLWRNYRSRKLFFLLSATSRGEVEDSLARLEAITPDKAPVSTTELERVTQRRKR